MPTPSAELAATYFPGTPVLRALAGDETLLSIARARELIGYEPKASWRHI
jgi:hypothetical protein